MSASNFVASGQDLIQNLNTQINQQNITINQLESRIKQLEATNADLNSDLIKANRQWVKDSIALWKIKAKTNQQATKDSLKLWNLKQKNKQSKLEASAAQIARLQRDSVLQSHNIATVAAERDRFKVADLERNRVKTSYDSLAAVLRITKSECANDTIKLYYANFVLKKEKDDLQNFLTAKQAELTQFESALRRTQTGYDSIAALLNSERIGRQTDLQNSNIEITHLKTEREALKATIAAVPAQQIALRTSRDSLVRAIAALDVRLRSSETELAASNAIEAATKLLNKAYNKPETDVAIAGLDKIPASSAHYAEAKRIRNLLANYHAKTGILEKLQSQINQIDSNASSMTMKAQYLNNVFSWITDISWIHGRQGDAGAELREYPFLSQKLQELIVNKIKIMKDKKDTDK
jgi:hypothetical protein